MLSKLAEKIYLSRLFERYIDFQARTFGKWQTYLLKIPIYWRWHSLKYYNVVHWAVLFSFATGLFIGIALPLSARRQPGRGQEFAIIPPSNVHSTLIAYPNLISTTGDSAQVELILRDQDLNPLSERKVEIFALEGDVIVNQAQDMTSANGVLYSTVQSGIEGVKTIKARDLDSNTELDITAQIEFTSNSIAHWKKPGSIFMEGATSTTLDVSGSYAEWQANGLTANATSTDLISKRALSSDSCILRESLFYCAGGVNEEIVDDFYSIDPSSDIQTELSSLPYPVQNHKLVSTDNIYLIGGSISENELTSLVYQYDEQDDEWIRHSNMPSANENFEIAIFENNIYVIGGYDGTVQLDILYALKGNNWAELPGMNNRRNHFATAVWRDKIYVFGGWNGENVINSSEVFSIGDNKWAAISPMPTPRWGHSAVTFRGKIYIIGGYDSQNNFISEVDIFDPNTNSWIGSSFEISESKFSIDSDPEQVFLIGGDKEPSKIISYTPEEFSILITKNENLRRAGNPSTQFEILNEDARGEVIERSIPVADLSDSDTVILNLYSTKTGDDLITFMMGEISSEEQEFKVPITEKNLWQEISIDISNVPTLQRDGTQYLGFKINDASDPFRINIYDIWTQGAFFTQCPCEREVANIFYSKGDEESWGKVSWVASEAESSSTQIRVRSAGSMDGLSDASWRDFVQGEFESLNDNFVEFMAVLRDEQFSYLPEFYSLSVEKIAL